VGRIAARPPPKKRYPIALAGAIGVAISQALDQPSNIPEYAEFQQARWLVVPDGFDPLAHPIIATHWFGLADRAEAA
jgi:hypothetical protein